MERVLGENPVGLAYAERRR